MIILDSSKTPDGITINGAKGSNHYVAGADLSGAPECVVADLLAAGLAFDDEAALIEPEGDE